MSWTVVDAPKVCVRTPQPFAHFDEEAICLLGPVGYIASKNSPGLTAAGVRTSDFLGSALFTGGSPLVHTSLAFRAKLHLNRFFGMICGGRHISGCKLMSDFWGRERECRSWTITTENDQPCACGQHRARRMLIQIARDGAGYAETLRPAAAARDGKSNGHHELRSHDSNARIGKHASARNSSHFVANQQRHHWCKT
eukprot:5222126-Pleurochrysis_carterae.AAC.3